MRAASPRLQRTTTARRCVPQDIDPEFDDVAVLADMGTGPAGQRLQCARACVAAGAAVVSAVSVAYAVALVLLGTLTFAAFDNRSVAFTASGVRLPIDAGPGGERVRLGRPSTFPWTTRHGSSNRLRGIGVGAGTLIPGELPRPHWDSRRRCAMPTALSGLGHPNGEDPEKVLAEGADYEREDECPDAEHSPQQPTDGDY